MCRVEGQGPGSDKPGPNFLPVQIIVMSCGCERFTFSHTQSPSVIMGGGCGHTHFTDEQREEQRGAGMGSAAQPARADCQLSF